MSEWMPIDSAPKDGTRVLVYQPSEGAGVAEFDGARWLCGWGDYDWVDEGGARSCLKSVTPTHWMPIPLAPTSAEE